MHVHDVIYRLEKTLETSLNRHIDVKRPLLLALSGGSDSMALLGLLLNYRNQISPQPLSLFAVYVDHQWRPESGQEALSLQKYAEKFGIPLFIHALDGEPFNEEVARRGRLNCFRMLMQQTNSQAVCLAHHRDDQEETLLKRLFEGSGITQLQGMQEFALRDDGLCLWRPLLSHCKQDLLFYIQEKQMPHWKDYTNEDPRFLRVRMRQRLIPLLSEHFGKEIGSSLHYLRHEAQELQTYLEARLQEGQVHLHKGPLGIFWEWENTLPDPYLLRYYLRQTLKQHGLTLSRKEVERTQKALSEKRVHYQIRNAQKSLFIDRERLFLLENKERKWCVKWQEARDCDATDWRSGWQGCWSVQLPPGRYVLRLPRQEDRMHWRGEMRRCHEVWRICRVPVTLRTCLPVIIEDATRELGVWCENEAALNEQPDSPQKVIAQFLVKMPQQVISSQASWTLQLTVR